jgi:hypothetical protein
MNTLVARLLQPAPPVFTILAGALVMLLIAAALALVLAAGVDSIGVAYSDTTPFRWA